MVNREHYSGTRRHPIPDCRDRGGTCLRAKTIRLFTEDELNQLAAERKAMLDLQMPSFVRGDEDESAEDFFEIPS
jgi:hypothetical protein